MKTMTNTRDVTVEGVAQSAPFGISDNPDDLKFLRKILRRNIYSDKVLAPLREYSANAWDAHVEAGKPDLPIEVQLPTVDNPILTIKDWGLGLSNEAIMSRYVKYVISGKRDSAAQVGSFGIGAKSGFAYADTFTVISRHGGKARTYIAMLDENDDDAIHLLSEEDCGEDTGMTIQIPVQLADIAEFTRKARLLFQHFTPRPKINIELPTPPAIRSRVKEGIIFDLGDYGYQKGAEWIALMGCIPYKIDVEQLKDPEGKSLISSVFSKNSGILEFKVGEIQISASRESLEYSKVTKAALVRKFEALLEEYLTVVLNDLDNGTEPNWTKRVNAQKLLRLGLTRAEIGDWASESLKVENTVYFEFDHTLQIRNDLVLVRQTPTDKSLEGYNIHYPRVLLKPREIMQDRVLEAGGTLREGTSTFYGWDLIEPELQKLIQDNKLEGIPIVDLHEQPWEAPYVAPRKQRQKSGPGNPKHFKRVFRLTDTRYQSKRSENWEVVSRKPTADDVYVIISGFETLGMNIYEERREDVALAELFGVELPDIFGYKTTEKKPVDPAKVVGIPYADWRKKFLAALPVEKVKEALNQYHWNMVPKPSNSHKPKYAELVLERLTEAFGAGHAIPTYLRTSIEWTKPGFNDYREKLKLDLLYAHNLVPAGYVPEPVSALKTIKETYPLLELSFLWGSNQALEWRRYVKLIDAELKSAVVAPILPAVLTPLLSLVG